MLELVYMLAVLNLFFSVALAVLIYRIWKRPPVEYVLFSASHSSHIDFNHGTIDASAIREIAKLGGFEVTALYAKTETEKVDLLKPNSIKH